MPRRPRRTAEQWEVLISQFDAGSATADAFCQQHDVNPKTFQRWRYQFSSKIQRRPKPKGFVELKQRAPPSSCSDGFSLHLGNHMHLELPAMPTAELAALLKAVARA